MCIEKIRYLGKEKSAFFFTFPTILSHLYVHVSLSYILWFGNFCVSNSNNRQTKPITLSSGFTFGILYWCRCSYSHHHACQCGPCVLHSISILYNRKLWLWRNSTQMVFAKFNWMLCVIHAYALTIIGRFSNFHQIAKLNPRQSFLLYGSIASNQE